MLAERTKLFDTSLYSSSSPEVVAEDLAGLYIEAGDAPLEERINARKLRIEGGKVYDPKANKEVPGNLKRNSRLDNLEADSAEAFYHQITGGYSLTVAFSPPGGTSNYKEGRVNVGYRSSNNEMEFYGIPTHLMPEAILAKSIALSAFSDLSLSEVKNPDDLRGISIPILLPETETSPWEFLEEMLPLDSDAWKYIKERRPWLIKSRALEDALMAAPNMVKMISLARVERDFIVAGAYGERFMEQSGWKLNNKSCPGKSNSELLNNTATKGDFVTDAFGNVREVTSWEYHTGNCVNCGASGVDVGPCSICKACEKKL
jgi:hypothetical protein